MASLVRDKIIAAAHDLFVERGFHAVGLTAIISAVGVTKTTFYNHFESKEQLVAEVLAWHDRWWKDTFRQLLRDRGGDDPRAQLLALPALLDHAFGCDDFNGCFFVGVAVQFPDHRDPNHVAAADHKRSMEDLLRELAGYARARDAKALAEELALIIEGAYVTKQVSGNPRTTEIARRLIARAVEAACPAGQSPFSGGG